MNINGISQFGDEVQPLQKLFKNTGSCVMNGFIGDAIDDLNLDEDGRFSFSTHKEFDEEQIDSKGVVLSNSILLKQVQKGHEASSYRIYSWDVEEGKYTFLSFDNPRSMDRFFEVIKRFDANLCDEDISLLFQEMGLTFDSVTQILVNQERSPIDVMFDEDDSIQKDSFVK